MSKTKEEKAAYFRAYNIANRERIAARNKAYREEHKEELAARHRASYEANKKKISEHGKKYYAENKTKISERSKAYYASHREEILAQEKEYNAVNREKIKARCREYNSVNKKELRNKWLVRIFGISQADYESMLADQGGVCAICGKANWQGRWHRPHIDHDHKSGKVRGILCQFCNVALGHIEENIKTAQAMVDYLRRFKTD